MDKRRIFAISVIIAFIIALCIFIPNSLELSAIAVVAFSFIVIAYLRSKEYFHDRAPGKYYVYANYVIGFTILGAILLVDINFANYHSINQSLHASIYTAELITGALFTLILFWNDHKKHIHGRTSQKSNDIAFITLSSIIFIIILIFSIIVDINYAV